uniref:Macaca fascicularis brain cDNA clone: QbsA-10251, similar to human inositol polyphosphate-5-phosphatase, 75kDa (INPP5B), mRNA, RefSeq: XM_375718.1 n=1 Tax=Macaca fascicularis TaxID=9541 RepID=I7G3Y2_MACFA|nr:unnamed protein product [Macaca fascicularis]
MLRTGDQDNFEISSEREHEVHLAIKCLPCVTFLLLARGSRILSKTAGAHVSGRDVCLVWLGLSIYGKCYSLTLAIFWDLF